MTLPKIISFNKRPLNEHFCLIPKLVPLKSKYNRHLRGGRMHGHLPFPLACQRNSGRVALLRVQWQPSSFVGQRAVSPDRNQKLQAKGSLRRGRQVGMDSPGNFCQIVQRAAGDRSVSYDGYCVLGI